MWVQQILLALIGLSAGVVVAGGLFSFIVELGVVSDFADRTHTADKLWWYESSIAAGGILANIFWVFGIQIPFGKLLIPVFGLFAGIFVGCWAMGLAEVLNLFPVFTRRTGIIRPIPWIVFTVAVGKGLASLLYFFERW